MNTLSRKDFSGGWNPSADAVNCPPNALLRMDNLVLDDRGILSLRKGISSAISAPGTSINNLFTANLNGTKYRMVSAGSAVYSNGSTLGIAMPGTTDVQFASYKDQIFFARSTTKKKYDGSATRNWGIQTPIMAPTAVALANDGKVFGSFNGATHATPDSPAWVADTGTIAEDTGQDAVAYSAQKTTPNVGSGQTIITKTYTNPVNFTVYDLGNPASVNDLIQFWVYISTPQDLSNINLYIDVNSGDFQTDYYTATWTTAAYSPPVPDIAAIQNQLIQAMVPESQWPAIIDQIWAQYYAALAAYEAGAGSTQFVGGTWVRFSIARSSLARYGTTAGKDWSTVKAVRFLVNNIAASTGTVTFDNLEIVGGVESNQVGNYRYRIAAVRNTGYQIVSAPSSASELIILRAQGTTVTIPEATLSALDPQATEIWLYRMGGTMTNYFRVASLILQFDHTAPFETEYGADGSQANYTCTFESELGGTVGPSKCNYEWERTYGYLTISTIVDNLTDTQAMAINIKMQSDTNPPPDNIIGICGPYYDRLFCLTETMLWPSLRLKPDSYAAGQVITVGGDDEIALWIAQALGGLYIGTTKDIYRLDGDGAEYPDGTMNFTKVPVNNGNPPISSAFAREGNAIVYLASDGWRTFNGSSSTPIKGDTDLLWKGETRHGVSPVNVTGATSRFRAAIWNSRLVAITPEGSNTTSSTAIHNYHFDTGKWNRYTYTQAWTAIHREPDGTLIAGNAAGTVHQLETGTKDVTTDIPVVLWTPVEDAGLPNNEKEAQDLQIRIDTGSNAASIALYLDGGSVASDTQSVNLGGSSVYQYGISDLVPFRQLQLRATGSFSTFKWLEHTLSYLALPETRRAWNLGSLDVSDRDITWIREIRVKARASGDLTMVVSFDGSATPTKTVIATVGMPTVYDVSFGRGIKGKAPKVIITSTADFVPYWIDVTFRGSGGETQKSRVRIKA
jgi:hypothetical protein